MSPAEQVLRKTWHEAWKPADRRPIHEWAADNVKLPTGSAYAIPGWFDVSHSRHLIEPFAAFADYDTRQINTEKGVQSAGSLAADIEIQWIFAENPGTTMFVFHNDDDAKEHWRSRIEKSLLNGPHAETYAKKRKSREHYQWDHMELWVAGANEGSAQSKTVLNLFCDEVWRYDPIVVNQLLARTHFVKRRCKVVFTSQASIENDHWHSMAHEARRYVRHAICENPRCREAMPIEVFQRMKQDPRERAGLVFGKKLLPNGLRDHDHAYKTAAFRCPHCGHLHATGPLTKARFNDTGHYIVENPAASDISKTFRWTSLINGDLDSLASDYVKALNARDKGHIEPLKNFYMQKAVKYWTDEYITESITIETGNFKKLEEWDRPHYKIILIDYQIGEGNDTEHFITVTDCWAKDGSGDSRMFDEKRYDHHEDIRTFQLKHKIASKNVFIDGGEGLHDKIGPIAARYGWQILIGAGDRESYTHLIRQGGRKISVTKPFSPKKSTDPFKGTKKQKKKFVYFRHWANRPVKDMLHVFRSGAGPYWGTPSDASKEFHDEMNSEHKIDIVNKVTGRVRKIWTKKKRTIGNHRWDCKAMSIVVALIYKLIPFYDTAPDRKPETNNSTTEESPSETSENSPKTKKPVKIIAPHNQPDQMDLF